MSSNNDPVSLMKEGKKLATKSLFRWKADYDGAAECFEKAGNLFKMQRKIDDAIAAYKQAGDAYHRGSNFYNSAKAIEMVGNIMRDNKKKPSEVARVYKKAAEIFQEDGKPERAGEVLTKAIKMLEREYSKADGKSEALREEIMDMYTHAIDVFDDKYHLSGDLMRSFNSFLVREGQYTACIENIGRQIAGFEDLKQPHNIWKCYLSVVILHLKMGDWPAADEAHHTFVEKHPEYTQTEEGNLAQQMLDAFEQYNEELLQRALQSNKLKFINPQIFKVARTLTITGDASNSDRKPRQRRREETDESRRELFKSDEDEKEHEPDSNEGKKEREDGGASDQEHDDDNEERVFDPYDFT